MTKFVINPKDDAPDVVHRGDCRTIRHQVDEDERHEQAALTYEHLGTNENSYSTILETSGPHASHFAARYVTIEQLQSWPKRYRRCQHCSPEAPESGRTLRPDRDRMQARSVKSNHLGREFVGIGKLLSVRMSADGYELIGTTGSLRVPLDGQVDYIKRLPRPASSSRTPGESV